MKNLFFLATTLLLCLLGNLPRATAQAVGGLGTDVRYGSVLPAGAKPSSIFVITGATPWTVWLCQTSPACMSSGDWTQIGSLSSKADLVSGIVPAAELGTGTAGSGTCLLGNGTWGTCGTGGVPTGVANGSALVSSGIGAASVYQTKPVIDSADLRVVADGSTDVCTTFQAWIDANPGAHLWAGSRAPARARRARSPFASYYSSCTLHLKYNGTVLDG